MGSGSCLKGKLSELLPMALLAHRPGAGCGTESHVDYQELLSRGHGQRQPPTLCHHPGEPGQVSGSSMLPPQTPWGRAPSKSLGHSAGGGRELLAQPRLSLPG